LIILQGVHQQIPQNENAAQAYKILPPPSDSGPEAPEGSQSALATDADRLRDQYKQAGDTQHHTFGEGTPGSPAPDFTKIQGVRAGAPPVVPPKDATAKQANPPQPNGTAQPGANGAAATNPPKPGATTTTGTTAAGAPPANKPPVAKNQAEPVVPIPPAKPRPRTPILVTDPTDADPGADSIPPAKSEKKPPRPNQ